MCPKSYIMQDVYVTSYIMQDVMNDVYVPEILDKQVMEVFPKDSI